MPPQKNSKIHQTNNKFVEYKPEPPQPKKRTAKNSSPGVKPATVKEPTKPVATIEPTKPVATIEPKPKVTKTPKKVSSY